MANTVDAIVYTKTNIGSYFFDAFLRLDHTSRLRVTQHPVQTGAAITDHAILEPKEIIIEVGMSDCATSFIPGQFDGSWSRSVKAWEVLKQLQESRIPINVLTRLGLYKNMLIVVLSAPDDYRTLHGLRATVTLQEILVAEVSTVKISARPHVTGKTKRGSPEPVNPNQSILTQLQGLLFGN